MHTASNIMQAGNAAESALGDMKTTALASARAAFDVANHLDEDFLKEKVDQKLDACSATWTPSAWPGVGAVPELDAETSQCDGIDAVKADADAKVAAVDSAMATTYF